MGDGGPSSKRLSGDTLGRERSRYPARCPFQRMDTVGRPTRSARSGRGCTAALRLTDAPPDAASRTQNDDAVVQWARTEPAISRPPARVYGGRLGEWWCLLSTRRLWRR